MIALIVVCLIIIAFFFLLPVIVVKISHSSRLKTWQKVFSNIFIVIIGLLLAFAYLIWVEYGGMFGIDERSYPLSKDPKVALEYLEDIGINIQLPEFKVKRHSIMFEGGSDIVEWWEIKFIHPITESFKVSLDSLVHAEPVRWRHDKIMVRREMSADEEEYYVFSFWDSKHIITQENVAINISANEATLTHRKI